MEELNNKGKKRKTKSTVKYDVHIGDKFNRLTVVSDWFYTVSPNGYENRTVHCICDCGNELDVFVASLCNGNTKSCGCLKVEKARAGRERVKNTYETDGDVTKVFDKRGNYTLIDTEDLEKIKDFYAFENSSRGYWMYTHGRGKMGAFHRLLTDCPKDLVVDHLNHNRADNRKCNLKVCTQQDNSKNKPFIGVVLLEHIDKWQASVKEDGKIKYIGIYDTFDEAVKAVKDYWEVRT